MRILLLSLLLVSALGSEFLNERQERLREWPPIHVDYDFQVDFDFMIWEPTLKKLIPYANMNGT